MAKQIKDPHIEELLEYLKSVPGLNKKNLTSLTFRKKHEKNSSNIDALNKLLNEHPVFKDYELTNIKFDAKPIFEDIIWCERPPGSKHYEPC